MRLEVKNLKVDYDGAEVIKGISFNISEGEIVTLIGNNGAGKTTTLRTISGLKHLSSGEIWFNDKRLDQMSPQHIVKAGICHVPQGRELFPFMTVTENLLVGAFLVKDKRQIKINLEYVYEHFPILKQRRNQQAGTLSGGEQQMLAIAIACMGSPKLLLLDEPSIGLSPIMVNEISRIILEINGRGVSILLVEQNARLALKLAKRCYVLETGNIVLEGRTEELINNEIIKKAYLGQ